MNTLEKSLLEANVTTPGEKRRGFALVIALVFMAFMLLLLLSISSLTRMETQRSQVDKRIAIAKHNAKFSASIALGQLQKTLGPDQRVSASADILNPANTSANVIGPVAHPNWVGVWDSDRNFIEWLVSGPELVVQDENSAQSGLDGGGILASSDASSSDTSNTSASLLQAIQVPFLESNEIGRIAYLVEDNSQKAAFFPLVEDTGPDYPLSPPRFGFEVSNLFSDIIPGSVTARGAFIRSELQSKPLPSLSSLMPIVDGMTEDDLRYINRHATTHSYGLMTDTKSGGLQEDLTERLYDGPLRGLGSTAASVERDLLFAPQRAPNVARSLQDPGGPTWRQLQGWARNGEDLDSAGTLPVRGNLGAPTFQVGISPVITGFQMFFLPNWEADTDRLFMHVMPAVTLWNPYNKPLEATDYRIQMGRAYRSSSLFRNFEDLMNSNGNPWAMNLYRREEGDLVNQTLRMIQPRITDTHRNERWMFDIQDLRLEPGESAVFTPLEREEMTPGYRNFNPPFPSNELGRGFTPEESFYYHLRHDLPNGRSGSIAAADDSIFDGYGTDPDVVVEYDYNVSNTRLWGFRLLRRISGDTYEPLQEVNLMSIRLPEAPPIKDVPRFSIPAEPITTTLIDEHAVGPKAIRTFVQNQYNPVSETPLNSVRWLASYNPRAHQTGPNPLAFKRPNSEARESRVNNPSFIASFESFASDVFDIGIDSQGVSFDESATVDRAILFEPPPSRSVLQNIGQLQHAPLFYWPGFNTETNMRDGLFDNLVPAYAIGNSLADPKILPDRVAVEWQGDGYNIGASASGGDDSGIFNYQGWHYDQSFLMNETLYDGFFLSGADPSDDFSVNIRHIPIVTPDLHSNEPDPDFGTFGIAANHWIQGAFNVNSTSREAWASLLGSYFGIQMDGSYGGSTSIIRRMREMVGSPVGSGASPSNSNSHLGYRVLSQSEIFELADAIVEQVRARGPFTSLADFVNRMPERDAPVGEGFSVNDFRLQGALSAAIERADINNSLATDTIAVASGLTWGDGLGMQPEAEVGSRSHGISSWLTQADVLSQLDSVLRPRSDTFTIRAYGESPGTVPGEAPMGNWCEMVVQRVPAPVGDLVDGEIGPLGRKFVVVAFRWLSMDEI